MPLVHRLRTARGVHVGGALATFFSLKVAMGLILISVSTSYLSNSDFVAFSQLFLLFALLSTISAAGVQNGLARQIAAAHGVPECEHRAAAAAFRIWIIASLVALALATLLRKQVSDLLVGDGSLAGVIPAVTMVAAGGGFGILACAILNGRQRAPTSLLLQSVGLAIGGLLCVWRLAARDPAGAVLGYAAGPVVTSLLSMLTLRRAGIRYVAAAEGQRGEVRLLIGYSLTFLGIAVIMPATLFALRHVYREAFDTNLLSYWLAANRVSDVTSQILGLYMAQIFLPQVVREGDPERIRRLIGRTLVIGSLFMLGGWAVFALRAPYFVTTFLSASYLPAIPFISGYLLGDALRVTASLTSNLMMARRRLIAAVGIELMTAIMLAAYVLGLSRVGRPEAPYWGYPAAYATVALIILARVAMTSTRLRHRLIA